MSTILDKNQKPINGQDQNRQTHDVRVVPTGTLIYNLIRFTGEDVGLGNAIQQFEMAKQQQKMVVDPPQLAKLKEHHQEVQHHRYIIAAELNARFADLDGAYRARLGIEIIEPIQPEPDLAPTKES
jgi:hypothetical protein